MCGTVPGCSRYGCMDGRLQRMRLGEQYVQSQDLQCVHGHNAFVQVCICGQSHVIFFGCFGRLYTGFSSVNRLF